MTAKPDPLAQVRATTKALSRHKAREAALQAAQVQAALVAKEAGVSWAAISEAMGATQRNYALRLCRRYPKVAA